MRSRTPSTPKSRRPRRAAAAALAALFAAAAAQALAPLPATAQVNQAEAGCVSLVPWAPTVGWNFSTNEPCTVKEAAGGGDGISAGAEEARPGIPSEVVRIYDTRPSDPPIQAGCGGRRCSLEGPRAAIDSDRLRGVRAARNGRPARVRPKGQREARRVVGELTPLCIRLHSEFDGAVFRQPRDLQELLTYRTAWQEANEGKKSSFAVEMRLEAQLPALAKWEQEMRGAEKNLRKAGCGGNRTFKPWY